MSSDEHTPGSTRESHELHVDDGDGGVTVRKRVSQGERLEIDSGEDSVKLDALLLEGLSWQRDRGAIDDLLGSDVAFASDPVAEASHEYDEKTPTISIASEYSHAEVRAVTTPAGRGIEVTTPGRGTSVVLGSQSLRALATVEDTYVFSVWFETPFGPEDTPVEGPL
jgi:hypothetical protein